MTTLRTPSARRATVRILALWIAVPTSGGIALYLLRPSGETLAVALAGVGFGVLSGLVYLGLLMVLSRRRAPTLPNGALLGLLTSGLWVVLGLVEHLASGEASAAPGYSPLLRDAVLLGYGLVLGALSARLAHHKGAA